MAALFYLLLITIGISNAISESLLTPVVQIRHGPVQGKILETAQNKMKYSSFRGIPYAQPPTGYRRFRPPQDIKPWSQVLEAFSDGSNCIQKDSYFGTYTGSEDCLYLNVYTPRTKFSRGSLKGLKPVMIWIYGGRFLTGYANSSVYGPDFIVEHDVVLVSFNYRVGPLGFLNLGHEYATGNAGLKDQNAALKWVQKNIIYFGGDPNSVTLFGQSAGAASVDYHVLSDMSKGLFHRSISMSGSPLVPWGFQKPEDAVKSAFELGKRLGVETTSKSTLLNVLYKASPVDITRIGKEMTKISSAFRPSVERTDIAQREEKFLTECPKTKYKEGRFNKVPHIMGIMKNECVSFAKKVNNLVDEIKQSKKETKSRFAQYILNPLIRQIEKLTTSVSSKALDIATNILFLSGINEKQRLMYKHNGSPIYYYQISVKPKFSLHKNIRNITLDGAAHGDDLLYLFHTQLFDIPMDKKSLLTITRDRVLRLWTNFAKRGDPNPAGGHWSGFAWPRSNSSGVFLDIGEHLSIVNKRPGGKSVKLLESLNVGIASC